MSLYAKYVKEHHGDDVFETAYGFTTYRYLDEGKTIYFVDMYVHPDFRRTNHARFMADNILERAKANGCKELIATVVPSANNATDSLKVLLAYGLKLSRIEGNLIVLKKEI